MSLLSARDIVAFPGGDNSSDTIINGVHLNKTTLDFWNYTLFSNGTLSNTSWCILTFSPYTPVGVLDNGTFVNGSWCYRPVYPIGQRASIGIGFASLYAISLALILVCLHKHGKLYLPAAKRFRPIGRRWQWYWAIFACTGALISLFTTVDVDRYFLPQLPIVLTSFFWYLMQIGSMAIVWEAVRHWGSWMERQYIDPDPFLLAHDDRRSKVEFWIPLLFYFWLWMNFFILIPRNWGNLEHQRYPEQVLLDAMPSATDGRFKAGPFCLIVCWLITLFSLRHSIKHYCPRNKGLVNRTVGFFRYTPMRFYFLFPLAAIIPTYQALVAWEFAWSPLNIKGLNAAIYAGGYAPTLLIIFVQIVWGLTTPNEDKELKRQRRVRGTEIDQELGIMPKPTWWRRIREAAEGGGANENMRDRIARNVREVGGRKPTADHFATHADASNSPPAPVGDSVEMGSVTARPLSRQAADLLGPVAPGDFATARTIASRYDGLSERTRSERARQHAAALLFPGGTDAAAAAARRREELMMDGPPPYSPPPYSETERGRQATTEVVRPAATRGGTSIASTGSINSSPQQIRSMLDI